MSSPSRVAIIGGGFAGMAAASVLAAAGARPTLWESSPTLGGLAAGFQEAGWDSSVEHFYHHWFATDAEVRRFTGLWGVTDRLEFRRPLTGIETREHGIVQLNSAPSLLRYPEMPFLDRVRMGAALAFLKALPSPDRLEGATAAAWCRRWMGAAGSDAIWEPLLRGKFGPHAEYVGMPWLWARLHCRTASLGSYRGGFGALAGDVEAWLRARGATLRLGRPAPAARRDGTGWWLGEEPFDHVIAAVGPRPFQAMFGTAAPGYAARLQAERSLGAQAVLLSLREAIGSWYWISLRKELHPFLAVVQHTRLVPPEAFGGEHLVYVADYLDTADPRWTLDDATLTDEALATCRRIAPGLGADVLRRSWVFRAAEAQPVMTAATGQNRPPTRVAEAPGLHHVSMAHVYPWDRGTNFALELGRSVAEEILAR
jgi:protoporphyrinogen oxidase